MTTRKVPFLNNELYHIYNRGVDKRNIFMHSEDAERFLLCMKEFNTTEPIGSLFALSQTRRSGSTATTGTKLKKKDARLVEFAAFCLNPNHFHFVLKQIADGGISEFMKRLSGGYTWHFNNKYKRSGALLQGRFKSAYINSEGKLLRLSAYVNLNYQIHHLKKNKHHVIKTSWEEYIGTEKKYFCEKDTVLGYFKNIKEYKRFALETIKEITKEREEAALVEATKETKELQKFLIE